ncbi:MAG: ATP-binding protein [Deltaproteobacteria bacterium]|nr:ATP-binding protein [Deltaproteobacteria bacterium]
MDGAVIGREAELAEIEAALAPPRAGFAALVLEGEAGIGKTTVWRQGLSYASSHGYRVLRCQAVQSEARLSFSALADLLAPVAGADFAALPDPQRRALDAALLRADAVGADPDPRAIGTGVVTLLAALAVPAPVLVAIDDVQWLDRASARALAFALRRLEPHPIVVLSTRRVGQNGSASGALAASERVVRLGPLSLASLYRIVEKQLGRALPRPLLVRIDRASGGNPCALGGSEASGELPIPPDLHQLVAGDCASCRLAPVMRCCASARSGSRPGRRSTQQHSSLPSRLESCASLPRATASSSSIRCSRRASTPKHPARAGGGCMRSSPRAQPTSRNARGTCCLHGLPRSRTSRSPPLCSRPPSTRCGGAPSNRRPSSPSAPRSSRRRVSPTLAGSAACGRPGTISRRETLRTRTACARWRSTRPRRTAHERKLSC